MVVTNEKEEIKDLITNYNNELNEREFVVIQLDDEKAFIDYKKMSKRFSQSVLKKLKKFLKKYILFLMERMGGLKILFSKKTTN